MKKYFSAQFWDYALERALKTAIQALIAGGFLGLGLFDMDWGAILSVAGGSALVSLATAVIVYKGDGTDNPNDTRSLVVNPEEDDSYPSEDVDAGPTYEDR